MFSSRNRVYTFGALLLESTTVTVGNELVKLSGDQEVPPTKASGKGMIVVNSDKSLKGEVTASTIHLHPMPENL
ncbi:MAG: CHRD domain-containing protein [Burkholderiales bacterium]